MKREPRQWRLRIMLARLVLVTGTRCGVWDAALQRVIPARFVRHAFGLDGYREWHGSPERMEIDKRELSTLRAGDWSRVRTALGERAAGPSSQWPDTGPNERETALVDGEKIRLSLPAVKSVKLVKSCS